MTLPHIPVRFVKWMVPAVLLVVAGAVVWMLHTPSDHEMDAFDDTPAWTRRYSAGSTVFGDPAPVTPQPNDRTAVSFGSNTDGVSGEPTTSSADPYATTSNSGTQRGNSDGTYRPRAAPASAQPARSRPAVPTGSSPAPQYPTPAADAGAPGLDTHNLQIPPFYTEKLFAPLPGAQTRGVGISEWESYRTDVAGKDILVTTDDSNFYKDRNGKLNGNTGDTDASGLNVTDATDSTILGSESADEAPWQTVAQALVDILTSNPRDDDSDPGGDDSDDDGDADLPDPGANPEDAAMTAMSPVDGTDSALSTLALMQTGVTSPGAAAAVIAPPPSSSEDTDDEVDPDDDDSDDDGGNFDFPYDDWTQQISGDRASAVHTDDGTTLASGADALVVGGDGFDDDDNRAAGENIVITRDDNNVVIGGTGDVNAQIGDSEQGAVIMGVTRTFIKGGGAY
jgi:hypothetical protein